MSGQISIVFKVLTDLFRMFMSFEMFNTIFLVSIFCLCITIVVKLSKGN